MFEALHDILLEGLELGHVAFVDFLQVGEAGLELGHGLLALGDRLGAAFGSGSFELGTGSNQLFLGLGTLLFGIGKRLGRLVLGGAPALLELLEYRFAHLHEIVQRGCRRGLLGSRRCLLRGSLLCSGCLRCHVLPPCKKVVTSW